MSLALRMDQVGEFLREGTAELFEGACIGVLESVGDALFEQSPRLTGAFAGNWRPWRGSPTATFNPADKSPMTSEVRATLAGIKPGEAFGAVNAAPYGAGLVFAGRSRKVSRGWWEGAVRHGMRGARIARGG